MSSHKFFRFIEGRASPVSRLQSRAWSFASLSLFALQAVKDQNLCGKNDASMALVPKFCSLPKAGETQEFTASSNSYMYKHNRSAPF